MCTWTRLSFLSTCSVTGKPGELRRMGDGEASARWCRQTSALAYSGRSRVGYPLLPVVAKKVEDLRRGLDIRGAVGRFGAGVFVLIDCTQLDLALFSAAAVALAGDGALLVGLLGCAGAA